MSRHFDQELENHRPVSMDEFTRKRKRRPKQWYKHEPIEYRSTANSVRPYLERLPIELFTMIMDYLELRDILYLCQDPEFPVDSLLRRHLMNNLTSADSILHQVLDDGWGIIPMIKKFMQILGTWDMPGSSGVPLLNQAIVYERIDLCRIFIEAGARVNSHKPKEAPIPAPNTITRRGMDEITFFIDYEGDFSWAPDDPDLEPLHLATIVDNLDIVDLLLQHGADSNAPAGTYGSPLHLTESCRIAQSLLHHGADVNALNGTGSTPLMIAIAMCRAELVKLLLDAHGNPNIYNEDFLSAMTIACSIGNTKLIFELIAAGCDVQGLGISPPLHVAVEYGQRGIARILLQYGADVKFKNDIGTALHLTRDGEVAQLLLAFGAEIDAQDVNGETPLQLAVYRQDYEMFNVLVTAGADWKSPDIDLPRFLVDAVYDDEYATIRLLVADCNVKIPVDDTPLPFLIQERREGIARLLIETNPDILNLADSENDTPVGMAIRWASPSLLQKLLDAGADPDSGGGWKSKLDANIPEDKEKLDILMDAAKKKGR